MTVPESFLGGRQPGEELLADDVLDSHELGVFDIAVVDHTLDDILIEDRAVVMRLHLLTDMAAVEMEAIQICVDGPNGRLALKRGRTGREDVAFGCRFIPRCFDVRVSTASIATGEEDRCQ